MEAMCKLDLETGFEIFTRVPRWFFDGSLSGNFGYDGKWVLQTNDDTISVEDAACGYKG
ncbi:MAG: hypothetical protein QGG48_04560 [Desulfatiglandales bacterium]|nr:hypothetical protein [Desulfatiglandales bacterium]